MAQFNVVEMGKGVYSLATNPAARQAVWEDLGNYWNALKSGDAVVWGKTLFEVATIFIAVDDVAKATKLTKVSQSTSLLSKSGVFAKNLGNIALKNADDLFRLPTRAIDDLTALGKKGFQTLDEFAASLFAHPQYAFAGAGDSQSLLRMLAKEADDIPLTEVQKNFRAVMAEVGEAVSSKLDDVPNLSALDEAEQLKLASVYKQKAPITIPENAKIKAKTMKAGYEQITYKWSDEGFKYEVRWHTRTPGAPVEQGNTWVIQRTIPGSGGNKPQTFFKTGNNEWTEGYKWYDAIDARNKGIATTEQIRILDEGHWKE